MASWQVFDLYFAKLQIHFFYYWKFQNFVLKVFSTFGVFLGAKALQIMVEYYIAVAFYAWLRLVLWQTYDRNSKPKWRTA